MSLPCCGPGWLLETHPLTSTPACGAQGAAQIEHPSFLPACRGSGLSHMITPSCKGGWQPRSQLMHWLLSLTEKGRRRCSGSGCSALHPRGLPRAVCPSSGSFWEHASQTQHRAARSQDRLCLVSPRWPMPAPCPLPHSSPLCWTLQACGAEGAVPLPVASSVPWCAISQPKPKPAHPGSPQARRWLCHLSPSLVLVPGCCFRPRDT